MPIAGDKLTVKKECVCSRFTHEMTKYPRKGYQKENEPEFTLHPGDVVTYIETFINFYGIYYTVEKRGAAHLFDIKPENF